MRASRPSVFERNTLNEEIGLFVGITVYAQVLILRSSGRTGIRIYKKIDFFGTSTPDA